MNAQTQLLQAGGSVLGAALAVNKISEDAEHKKEKSLVASEQGALAKEQFHEASADITKLAGESVEAEKNLETAKKALRRTKEGSKANIRRMGELEAAQRAFDELQERIAAKEAMKARAEMIMKRTKIGGRK